MIKSYHNLLIFPCFSLTPASFDKSTQATSKQDVVGSSPTGRATSFIFNDLWVKAFLSDRLLFRQMDRHGGIKLFFSLLLLIQLFA